MNKKVTREEALSAVRTLIKWAGDDPEREGLLDTPKRVVNAYQEFFDGYNHSAEEIMSKTFEEVENYDDIVLLKNMKFESHCEHHMVPIIGVAQIAYLPNKKVVGLSKIARLLDIYAKRLQTQETMTAQIADAIDKYLKPLGIAVLIDAEHQCMSSRGVKKYGTTTVTCSFRGLFKSSHHLESKFYNLINN